ncbi:beta-phosphoglucomutase family hydrolase [Solirubrobacter ginsenosidimutans]|uniref:Beta-phosphoglucomutase n=1 Tax=Solirubrobacter ginsenosidimutans TaxID=490573 RepID=A0A9X3S7S2_9ACTN|nr:beta-phosphoglucomutase family hydrolase [Solirubrobacter ginsenosidimutans]MDA0163678.1 beta-phosphoglucomutase family hydrolase [Solirubrobacter ginsenosidimutans]
MLGLPDGITACLFDLDGVLTKTAVVHERAWKQTFDEFLGDRGTFEESDYNDFVDGKPREDGIRDFLASRHIDAGDDTVATLSERKNELVLKLIHDEGVEAYAGSVSYLQAARAAGLRRAVVSSSHNCEDVLRVAGLTDYLEVRVDGHVIDALGLRGKPAPDSFLEGARRLGVRPDQAVVFEDALAGVESGRAGKFGHVVGVDRVGHRAALLEHGADVVVDDLAELLP